MAPVFGLGLFVALAAMTSGTSRYPDEEFKFFDSIREPEAVVGTVGGHLYILFQDTIDILNFNNGQRRRRMFSRVGQFPLKQPQYEQYLRNVRMVAIRTWTSPQIIMVDPSGYLSTVDISDKTSPSYNDPPLFDSRFLNARLVYSWGERIYVVGPETFLMTTGGYPRAHLNTSYLDDPTAITSGWWGEIFVVCARSNALLAFEILESTSLPKQYQARLKKVVSDSAILGSAQSVIVTRDSMSPNARYTGFVTAPGSDTLVAFDVANAAVLGVHKFPANSTPWGVAPCTSLSAGLVCVTLTRANQLAVLDVSNITSPRLNRPTLYGPVNENYFYDGPRGLLSTVNYIPGDELLFMVSRGQVPGGGTVYSSMWTFNMTLILSPAPTPPTPTPTPLPMLPNSGNAGSGHGKAAKLTGAIPAMAIAAVLLLCHM